MPTSNHIVNHRKTSLCFTNSKPVLVYFTHNEEISCIFLLQKEGTLSKATKNQKASKTLQL